MRRIIKAFMQDASTASKFQFSLRCAVCGSLWKSRPAYFPRQRPSRKTKESM